MEINGTKELWPLGHLDHLEAWTRLPPRDLDLGVLSVSISSGENVSFGWLKGHEWKKLGIVSLFMVIRIVFTCLFISMKPSGGTVDGKNQETSWSSINSRIMNSLFANFQTCANYIKKHEAIFPPNGKSKEHHHHYRGSLGHESFKRMIFEETYWTTVICQWSDTQFNPMGIQVPCTFDLMFNPSKTWSEMSIHFLKYHWSPMLS